MAGPTYERIETSRGVVWRFHPEGGNANVTLSAFLAVGVAVPLALAAAAVAVIVRSAGQAEPAALALGGLFIAQTVFVAGLVGRFASKVWGAAAADLFGTHELELRADRLYLGRRLGPWRPGRWRAVTDLREVVLFLCRDSPAGDDTQPVPSACVAV